MRKSHWIGGAFLVLIVLAVSLTFDPLGLMTQGVDEPTDSGYLEGENLGAGGLKGRGTKQLPGADPESWEGEPVGRLVLSLGKAELEGTVTSEERPLRFARVRLDLPPPYHTFGVRTRKDGTWAIAGLPDGAHTVRASAEGHLARSTLAPAVAGEQKATVPPIDLLPRPENRNGIKVKVTDVFGRPLPGARVFCTTLPWDIHLAMGPEVTGSPYVMSKRGTTDELGEVELGPLPADDYSVVAMAPGYINAAVDKVVVAGNRQRTVALRLVEGVSVRGRVVDADGAGIENALVMGYAQPSFSPSLTTRSADDGSFVLDGLRKGGYMFIAWHETAGQTMQPGASPGQIEIKLAGTGKVKGKVVDADGKPVSDGRVRPFKIGPFQYVYSMVRPLEADGSFEFEVPAGEWNCRVQGSDGSMSDGNMVKVTVGETSEIEIKVDKSSLVRGVVMDEQGNHIAGAEVFVMQGGFPESPSREQYARTDGEGRFEVPGLPDRPIDLHVVHSDYADTKISVSPAADGKAREISVKLLAGASVVGSVTDSEGRGVAGEQVNLAMGWFDARSVYTDGDGAFRFDAVMPGEYSVTTGPYEQGARGLRKSGVQVGSEGVVRVDFRYPAASGSLGGLVTVAGTPIARAQVTVTDARGAERAVRVATDETGRFLAQGLQYGSVRVSVKTPDGLTGNASADVPEGDTAGEVTIDIGTARIRAQVVDPEGEPAAGCWITVERADSEESGWGRVAENGTSDGEGLYRSRGLKPGRYTLRVNRLEFAQYMSPVIELREGEEKDLGTIRMQVGVVLKGVIQDDAGSPVEKATVSLRDLQGNPIQMFSMATSGSDGSYQLHGVEAGRYIAHVQAKGHAPYDKQVELGDAGGSLDAVLTRGGTVRIRVVDQGGEPIASANVSLYDAKGVRVTRTISLANLDTGRRRTGPDGWTSLDDLASGAYTVRAERSGYAIVGAPPRTTIEPGAVATVTVTLEKVE